MDFGEFFQNSFNFSEKLDNTKVSSNLAFEVKLGEYELLGSAKTVSELKEFIKSHRQAYQFHVRNGRNDFANWISKAIGDPHLGRKVKNTKNREELVKLLDCPHCTN